jgi:hypothetical protein
MKNYISLFFGNIFLHVLIFGFEEIDADALSAVTRRAIAEVKAPF